MTATPGRSLERRGRVRCQGAPGRSSSESSRGRPRPRSHEGSPGTPVPRAVRLGACDATAFVSTEALVRHRLLTGEPLVRVRNGSPSETIERTWSLEVHVRSGRMRKVKPVFERPVRGQERWRQWQRQLDEGVYATKAELAQGEGVSRAAVTMGLRKLRLIVRDSPVQK